MITQNMQNMVIAFLLTVFLTQFLKVITSSIGKKGINWKELGKTGGMPSSHSAVVSVITVSVYLIEGFSTLFFVTLIFSLIVIDDALELRRHIQRHGDALRKITKGKEKIGVFKGHKLVEVLAGIFIGLGITLLIF